MAEYKNYNYYQSREVLRSLGTPPLTGKLVPTYFIEEEFKAETINPEEIEELIQYETAEDDVAYLDLKRTIEDTLDSLTPREAKVLRLRFGFRNKDYTLDDVASMFNCTRERIRQIEAKALRKMRHPARSVRLEMYINDGATSSLWEQMLEPVPSIDDYEGWGYTQAMEFLERDFEAWRKRTDEAIKKVRDAKKNLRGLI